MNQYDPYSDHRFDDQLNEHDARSRQHARRRAAEARSESRSHQEGPYASGGRSSGSRYSTRRPRNHYDAREEFARLDEEAHERDMRRIARQHGIAPRSVGSRPSDPYERAAIERLPARRLRERAEEHGHADDYHSDRYRDQSRGRVEEIEDPALLEQIHHSGDRPHGRRNEPAGPLSSLLGALPFSGGRNREDERHGDRDARRGSARRRADDERLGRRSEPADRARSGQAGRERTGRDGHPARRNQRTDRSAPAGRTGGEAGRQRPSGEPHRVGVERTRAQWRSHNDRPRTERRSRERSNGGFSARRNQVDMSPLGRLSNAPGAGSPGLPVGLIVKIVLAVAVIALIAFAAMNISRAVANAQTVVVNVDGTERAVKGSKDLNALLETEGVASQPGDLLAVDGSLIEEGGGYPATAVVNGELMTDWKTPLPEGADIQLSRGGDIVESSHVEERAIQPEAQETGNGPVHRVSQEGSEGRGSFVVGDVSGIAVLDGTLAEATPRVYAKQYVDTGGKKVIALTFDDGPLPDYTNQVLDVLKENGAKATFFTLGTKIEQEGGADCVKRAAEEGHQVCTHSYDHAAGSGQGVNMSYMSAEEQRAEVQKGQDAIANATGQQASPVFRSPGGNFPLDTWQNVEDLVSAEIGWNIDTTDWKQPGAAAIEKALLSAGPGDIILMHDGGGDRQQTVDALRCALPELKERGYSFVTVDELMQYALVDDLPKDEATED